MGTELSTRCGIPYPLHYLPLLRETWLVILNDNAILVAFVVMNVIPNSIFSQIAPISAMEEIMVAHPGIIKILPPLPILLPTKIQIMVEGSLKTEYPVLITIPILLTNQI